MAPECKTANPVDFLSQSTCQTLLDKRSLEDCLQELTYQRLLKLWSQGSWLWFEWATALGVTHSGLVLKARRTQERDELMEAPTVIPDKGL